MRGSFPAVVASVRSVWPKFEGHSGGNVTGFSEAEVQTCCEESSLFPPRWSVVCAPRLAVPCDLRPSTPSLRPASFCCCAAHALPTRATAAPARTVARVRARRLCLGHAQLRRMPTGTNGRLVARALCSQLLPPHPPVSSRSVHSSWQPSSSAFQPLRAPTMGTTAVTAAAAAAASLIHAGVPP